MENIKQPAWCQAGTSRAIKQIKISSRKCSPLQMGTSWVFTSDKAQEKNQLGSLCYDKLVFMPKADSGELM